MNGQPLLAAVIAATIVESIVETIMWLVEAVRDPDTRPQLVPRLTAIVVAIGLCVLAGIDIFPAVGIPLVVGTVGSVLTGLLLSRGANVLHDLIGKLQPAN